MSLAPLARFFASDRRCAACDSARDLNAENRRLRRLLASYVAPAGLYKAPGELYGEEDGIVIDFARDSVQELGAKLHELSLRRATAIRESVHATAPAPLD